MQIIYGHDHEQEVMVAWHARCGSILKSSSLPQGI